MIYVIKDVDVDWACLSEPDIKFKPTWRVDSKVTSERAKEIYLSIKDGLILSVKEALLRPKLTAQDRSLLEGLLESDKSLAQAIYTKLEDGTYRLRAKRSAASGNTPVQIVNPDKTLFSKGFIGRGDIVNLAVTLSAWTMGGKSAGISLTLEGVQIVKKGSNNGSYNKPAGIINWDGTNVSVPAPSTAPLEAAKKQVQASNDLGF